MRVEVALLGLALISCDGPGRSRSVGHGMRTLPGDVVAYYGTTAGRLEFVLLYPFWKTSRTLDRGTGGDAKGTFFSRRIEFADATALDYECRPEAGKRLMTLNGRVFDLAKGRVFFAFRRGGSIDVEQADLALPSGGEESLDRLTETIPDLPRRLEDRQP